VSDDIARLTARVAELERELAQTQRRAARAVAEAQRRSYWLDRWHVDLNALMERRAAERARAAVRLVRGPVRAARLLARKLR
jgi:hypothetical protein